MTPYYQDDLVTIYHGEALDTLRTLTTGAFDAVVTDPPYSSGGAFRGDRVAPPDAKYRGWSHSPDETRPPSSEYGTFGGDNRDQRSFAYWSTLWWSEALRVTRPGGQAFTFTDWRQLPSMTDALQAGGWTWRGLLVWDKGVGRPQRGKFRNHLEYVLWASHGPLLDQAEYPSALISVPTVGPTEREHVTQKPTALLRQLLALLPTHGLLLDPFMGSGTTLLAAKGMGWQSVGIEIEERYCEIAAQRCSQEVLFLSEPIVATMVAQPLRMELG